MTTAAALKTARPHLHARTNIVRSNTLPHVLIAKIVVRKKSTANSCFANAILAVLAKVADGRRCCSPRSTESPVGMQDGNEGRLAPRAESSSVDDADSAIHRSVQVGSQCQQPPQMYHPDVSHSKFAFVH